MVSKKNILVIGGAGYIGSHVTCELCDNNYNVTVLDDLSSGFRDNVDHRAKFIEGSFADMSLLDKVLDGTDAVVHLAALKAAGESMIRPDIYSEKNIIQSILLIN